MPVSKAEKRNAARKSAEAQKAKKKSIRGIKNAPVASKKKSAKRR